MFLSFAETFKALSDPVRREILELLKKGRMSAGEIASHFDMTQATVSYHLKILKKAEVSRRAMLSVTAFLAFCPAFYLTGGSVAPDALTAFFIVFAFYYTLLWEENHSWKNTLLLAAGYGMGMMTKISCGTIALLTAAVFIHTLWRETEKPGQLIRKYLVFAGISAPMGLWYSLRNLKKFGQSLNYVLEVPHRNYIAGIIL